MAIEGVYFLKGSFGFETLSCAGYTYTEKEIPPWPVEDLKVKKGTRLINCQVFVKWLP